jgi:hypothetical protein
MTNIQLSDIPDASYEEVSHLIEEKMEKISKAVQRLKTKKSGLPVISLGYREALRMGWLCLGASAPLDGPGRPSVGQALAPPDGWAGCGCPVVFHHTLYSRLVDHEGMLGVGPEPEAPAAPSSKIEKSVVRNGGTDSFNVGFLLAMAVRPAQPSGGHPGERGVPRPLIPTPKACLLMGSLLAAGFLRTGLHASRQEILDIARQCAPLTLSEAAKKTT